MGTLVSTWELGGKWGGTCQYMRYLWSTQIITYLSYLGVVASCITCEMLSLVYSNAPVIHVMHYMCKVLDLHVILFCHFLSPCAMSILGTPAVTGWQDTLGRTPQFLLIFMWFGWKIMMHFWCTFDTLLKVHQKCIIIIWKCINSASFWCTFKSASKVHHVFLKVLMNFFKVWPGFPNMDTPEPFPGTKNFPMIAVQNFHSRTLSWNQQFSHDCSAKFSLQNPFLEPQKNPMIAVQDFHSRTLSWNQKISHDCSARFSLQNLFLEPTVFPWLQCKIFTPEPFPGTTFFPMIAVQNFYSRTFFLEPKFFPWLQCTIFIPEPFPGTKKNSHDCRARFSLQNPFLEPTIFPWLQCNIFTPEPFPGTNSFPMIAVQDFHSRTLSWNQTFSHDCSAKFSLQNPFLEPKNPMIAVQDFHSRTFSWNPKFSHDCSARFSLKNHFLEPKCFPWLQCKIFTPEPFPGTKHFPMIAVQDFHSRTLSWNHIFSHDCSKVMSQDTVGALPRHSYLQSCVVMNTRHQWLNDSAVSAVIGSSIFSPKSLPNHWLIRGKNCTSTQA